MLRLRAGSGAHHASDGHDYLILSVREVDGPAWQLRVRRNNKPFVWMVYHESLPLIVDRREVCGAALLLQTLP